jgi:hypothetical protein
MDVHQKVSYEDEHDDDFLDEHEARMLDEEEQDERADQPELGEENLEETFDDEMESELAADASLADPASDTPYCPHGLMDILLPAIPPRPVNARLIRRLKD